MTARIRHGKAAAVRRTAHSEKIELPGARPVIFKLIDGSAGLFDLYRSSGKIGNARAGKRNAWAGQFWLSGERWRVTAGSAGELLKTVGTFVVATELRAAAARPVEEQNPELRAKGRLTADERLGLEWARRLQANRLAELDALLASCRRRIEPDPSP
jgi:hypothetical protein